MSCAFPWNVLSRSGRDVGVIDVIDVIDVAAVTLLELMRRIVDCWKKRVHE